MLVLRVSSMNAHSMTKQLQASRRRRPRSLAEQLVGELTRRIRDGKLKPGDKLPTESQLMDQEGVSRTVVREALSRLQAAGEVQTRHGIGTFVLASPPDRALRIAPPGAATLDQALAVLELRMAVEIESAGLAAERRGAPHLAALRSAVDRIVAGTSRADTLEADLQFHLQVAEASGNPYFAQIIGQLGAVLVPSARLDDPDLANAEPGLYLGRLGYEHEAIYEAIARRDSEGAKLAMRMHLFNSRERLRRTSEAAGSGPSTA